jgi:hypothetical protein
MHKPGWPPPIDLGAAVRYNQVMSFLLRGPSGVIVLAVLAAAALAGSLPALSTTAVPATAGSLGTGHSPPFASTLGELPANLFLDGELGEDGSTWWGGGAGARARSINPSAVSPRQAFIPAVSGRSAVRRAGFLARPTRAPPARSD